MQVTIDKFGRILIPKAVRELLGFSGEQALELRVDQAEKTIELKPAARPVPKWSKNQFSFPIIHSKSRSSPRILPEIDNGPPPVSDFDIVAFIKEEREAYLNRKMGFEEE
jgi:AbrB family looped-hinge helix DNA binding protein